MVFIHKVRDLASVLVLVAITATGSNMALAQKSSSNGGSGSPVASLEAPKTPKAAVKENDPPKEAAKPKESDFVLKHHWLAGGRAARLYKKGVESSVDVVAFKLMNYRDYNINDFEKDGGADFYKDHFSEKYATIDKSEKTLNEDLKALITQVARISSSQKITEATVVEKHPFWLMDGDGLNPYSVGSRAGKDYWYKFFEFKKHKVKLLGEQDEKYYHSLTIYSVDEDKELAEANRVAVIEERNQTEGRNDPTNAKDPDHIYLKTHNYVLDPYERENGNGNTGIWVDKNGDKLELESRS
jgi:hypothetical protein